MREGITSSALIGMIYCTPVETALRFTFMEFAAFEALEYAVEHDDSTLFRSAVAVINRQGMPIFRMADWWEAGREGACLNKIIRQAVTGILPPEECYDACAWLGIGLIKWAPMVAKTLEAAPFSAIQPLLNRTMRISGIYIYKYDTHTSTCGSTCLHYEVSGSSSTLQGYYIMFIYI